MRVRFAPFLLSSALLLEGCAMGVWIVDRDLAPGAGQVTVPVRSLDRSECLVLRERDASAVVIAPLASSVSSPRDVVTVRLEARDPHWLWWGPVFGLPPVVPMGWARFFDRFRGEEVHAVFRVAEEKDWPPALSIEPGDVRLVADDLEFAPRRIERTKDALVVVFAPACALRSWSLEVRRLRVGELVLSRLAPVRFEPDWALLWGLFP